MTRGEPIGNGSWTGILGYLRNDRCDFVVGGFFPDYDVQDDFGTFFLHFAFFPLEPRFIVINSEYLQVLQHHTYEIHTFGKINMQLYAIIISLTRNKQNFRYVFVAKKMPQWLAMLMIFKYTTWLLISLILILSAVSWYFFGRTTTEKLAHKNFALAALNSWSVFLCISSNNRPLFGPLRIFYITLALYGLNITTVFSSKLINVFTNPAYADQIDTIEEIIESKLPFGKIIVCQ